MVDQDMSIPNESDLYINIYIYINSNIQTAGLQLRTYFIALNFLVKKHFICRFKHYKCTTILNEFVVTSMLSTLLPLTITRSCTLGI